MNIWKRYSMRVSKNWVKFNKMFTLSPCPHHVAECFEHEIGIRVNGKERTNVEEYCISEGWVKIPSPKAKDRYGNPMLITVKGTVEAFYA